MTKIVLFYSFLLKLLLRTGAAAVIAGASSLAQAADMRTVESFLIQFSETKDEVMLGLALKRCAALHLLIAAKMEQANVADGATFNGQAADFFASMAVAIDARVDKQRGVETEGSYQTRKDRLIAGTITSMGMMYAEEAKQNQIRNGSIINGHPVLESDIKICRDHLKSMAEKK